jgi:hypothetical protein
MIAITIAEIRSSTVVIHITTTTTTGITGTSNLVARAVLAMRFDITANWGTSAE